MNVVAYACSSRPNALWSAAQFESALPKNRTECDTPLVTKADAEADLAVKDAEIAKLEDARAEQWRLRRDAEGSRDAAKAACDSMQIERDKLKEAMEGICHFSDALNFRNDHLSKALAQWIEAGRAALKENADG